MTCRSPDLRGLLTSTSVLAFCVILTRASCKLLLVQATARTPCDRETQMADSVIAVAAAVGFVFFVSGLFIGARLAQSGVSRDRTHGRPDRGQSEPVIQLLRELVVLLRQNYTAGEADKSECEGRHNRGRPSRRWFGRS